MCREASQARRPRLRQTYESFRSSSVDGLRLVRMERPTPIRSSWVTLRVEGLHNAEPHAKESVMNKVRFVGLDVHAETIAVAVAEPEGEVRSLGVIPNRPESIRRAINKLGSPNQLKVCY